LFNSRRDISRHDTFPRNTRGLLNVSAAISRIRPPGARQAAGIFLS
jgi:hypothetical protein